jgi:hypothetical protein
MEGCVGLDNKEEQARPDSVGADSLPITRRNEIDLNNEIADRDTGRAKRFLTSDSATRVNERKREEERRMSALMRAMQDPAYAAAYNETKNVADAARHATDTAAQRLAAEAQQAAEKLNSLRANAARLPDGTRVYLSRTDGRLYTEDGIDVSDQRDSVTGLTADSPAREDLDAAREEAERIAERQRQVEHYDREVLRPVEERLLDEDKPPSVEELGRDRDRLETEMPADIAAEYEMPASAPTVPARTNSAASEYVGDAELPAPDLNAHFAAAKSQESHDSSLATPLPANSPKLV